MEQYIPKSAVVAEIESLLDNGKYHDDYDCAFRDGNNSALNALKGRINTLEVKEVDVDKEINEHAEYMPQSEFSHDCEVLENIEWAKNEFRYFFELGMSVSKK